MGNAFENKTFPHLTNGYYLRSHIIVFLFLISVFNVASFRGPISFSINGVMGLWGAALIVHALWTFLQSGLYDPKREDTVERMIDQEMRSTSLSPHDEAIMTKVLDYDVRKAATSLQPLLIAAVISGFFSLLIWFVSEIRPPMSGPDVVAYARVAYIAFVLAVGFYYRNELFFRAVKGSFAKSKRFVGSQDITRKESKRKHINQLEDRDDSEAWEYESDLENAEKQRLRE